MKRALVMFAVGMMLVTSQANAGEICGSLESGTAVKLGSISDLVNKWSTSIRIFSNGEVVRTGRTLNLQTVTVRPQDGITEVRANYKSANGVSKSIRILLDEREHALMKIGKESFSCRFVEDKK